MSGNDPLDPLRGVWAALDLVAGRAPPCDPSVRDAGRAEYAATMARIYARRLEHAGERMMLALDAYEAARDEAVAARDACNAWCTVSEELSRRAAAAWESSHLRRGGKRGEQRVSVQDPDQRQSAGNPGDPGPSHDGGPRGLGARPG